MSTLRKYWQRHPVQLRILALLVMLVLPVYLPIVALIQFHREIVEEIVYQYRECWSLATTGKEL
jgi:hypothetical protein